MLQSIAAPALGPDEQCRPDPASTSLPSDTEAYAAIRPMVARFQKPVAWRGIWQLVTTTSMLFGLLAVMYALPTSWWWLNLLLALPAAGLVVRVFIIQHDCGHGSFLASRRANDVIGWCCSLLTFAPYSNWRHQHAHHHAVWNNLDRRNSVTDIYSTCLTVREYRALPLLPRWLYRLALHPIVALILLPPVVFLVVYRWPFDTPARMKKDSASVWYTNILLLAAYGGLAMAFGLLTVLLIHLTVMLYASIIGVWLFSIQHKFEHAQWARQTRWTPAEAALLGCSYLRLPVLLKWFTGNIGYHHLHHLAPRIPNYRLAACHDSCQSLLPESNTISLWQALRCYRFILWDENRNRLVGFREAWIDAEPLMDRPANAD